MVEDVLLCALEFCKNLGRLTRTPSLCIVRRQEGRRERWMRPPPVGREITRGFVCGGETETERLRTVVAVISETRV